MVIENTTRKNFNLLHQIDKIAVSALTNLYKTIKQYNGKNY